MRRWWHRRCSRPLSRRRRWGRRGRPGLRRRRRRNRLRPGRPRSCRNRRTATSAKTSARFYRFLAGWTNISRRRCSSGRRRRRSRRFWRSRRRRGRRNRLSRPRRRRQINRSCGTLSWSVGFLFARLSVLMLQRHFFPRQNESRLHLFFIFEYDRSVSQADLVVVHQFLLSNLLSIDESSVGTVLIDQVVPVFLPLHPGVLAGNAGIGNNQLIRRFTAERDQIFLDLELLEQIVPIHVIQFRHSRSPSGRYTNTMISDWMISIKNHVCQPFTSTIAVVLHG